VTANMFIGLFGGLAVFLYGMRVMSEGLQKVAGDRMRDFLARVTDNRFAGVATGLIVTSIIQSSSATTVMTVSFVNAGLITVLQSVGIIMGANIGTTVTGWLVSLLGFKVKISAFALPAVGLGFFARFLKQERITHWGEVLVGFGLLFLGLSFLKDALPTMQDSPALAAWLHRYHADGYGSTALVVLVGTAITVIVQSSSAVMAVTLAAAANGLVDFPTAAALILGENIGTTITAILASFGAQRSALRAATVHTMFNVIGVLWVWLLFRPVVAAVDWIVPGDPSTAAAIPLHLAMFHTLFNVTNTALQLPFARHLARLATWLVPEKTDRQEEPELVFLSQTLVSTPGLAVAEARREAGLMLMTVLQMFDDAMLVLRHPNEKMGTVVDRLLQAENRVDQLETRISHYLSHAITAEVSEKLSDEVRLLLGMVSDVERMGDHCERLLKLAQRRYDRKLVFSETAYKESDEMAEQVRRLLELLISSLTFARPGFFDEARFFEQKIDTLRHAMREGHIDRLREGGCDVDTGLIFLDMLNSFEKIGDHGFNVAQALAGKR